MTQAGDRDRIAEQLILEFQQQSLGLVASLGFPDSLEQRQWELLGRHHGLPSRILDWTTSPYIAAFFAFADPIVEHTESVAVWVLGRSFFSDVRSQRGAVNGEDDVAELWEEHDDYRFNIRAIEQGSVFMKIHNDALPLEETCGNHLWRFVIPSSEQQHVLSKLHEMRIDYRNLFRDLDYAAKTAIWRCAQDKFDEEITE